MGHDTLMHHLDNSVDFGTNLQLHGDGLAFVGTSHSDTSNDIFTILVSLGIRP